MNASIRKLTQEKATQPPAESATHESDSEDSTDSALEATLGSDPTMDSVVAAGSTSSGTLWNPRFILLMAVAALASTAITTQMGTLPLYVASLGGSEAISGLIVGVLGIAALICRFPIGILLDRYGRKIILVCGLAILLVDFTLLNLCRTLLALLCLRILQGIGSGTETTSSSTMAVDLIPVGKLTVGLGYFSLTQVVPGALGPLLGLTVVDLFGFQALFVLGTALTAAALLLSLFIKSEAMYPRRKQPKTAETPAAAPCTKAPGILESQSGAMQSPTRTSVAPHGSAAKPSATVPSPTVPRVTMPSLFLRPGILLPSLIMFLVFGANSGITVFVAQFAVESHIPAPGLFFVMQASVTLLIRVFFSPMLARCSQSLVIVGSIVMISVAFITVANASDLGVLLLAAVLCGAGQASLQPMMNALVLYGIEPDQRGQVTALFSASADVAYGGGALLWGWVAGLCGFRLMFVICGLCCALSLPCYAWLRLFRRHRDLLA
ncbi:MFS transporter [Bifidobacterium sp.]|uniref:MFS transporter n=1 Tax=Bifidobacterium sp. TaxID=41200 RepID=UPI0025C6E0F5|nr:MFS transporter [Bifidobacterium sp.]MCH4208814.1 MFS transporter [Bifidobacterium sp.]MCI1224772.1 MFS transporter [Bifidobacterium sp.]